MSFGHFRANSIKLNTPDAVVEKNAKGTAIKNHFDEMSLNEIQKSKRNKLHKPNELNVTGLVSVIHVAKIVYDAAKPNAITL